MTKRIALLRGINVGGHKQVAMPALRDLLQTLGLTNAQSLLQSGNLVFDSDDRPGNDLEALLEEETEARLGLRTHYFVRAAADWRRIIDANPFPDASSRDPSRFIVTVLKKAPTAAAIAALQTAVPGPESVQVVNEQAYIVYPDGIGRSKLTNAFVEDRLDCRGTSRNWNTVLKLADLVGA